MLYHDAIYERFTSSQNFPVNATTLHYEFYSENKDTSAAAAGVGTATEQQSSKKHMHSSNNMYCIHIENVQQVWNTF